MRDIIIGIVSKKLAWAKKDLKNKVVIQGDKAKALAILDKNVHDRIVKQKVEGSNYELLDKHRALNIRKIADKAIRAIKKSKIADET